MQCVTTSASIVPYGLPEHKDIRGSYKANVLGTSSPYAALCRGEVEVVLVRTLDSLSCKCGQHVDAARPQSVDQSVLHRIFVKVEANRHGVFLRRFCCFAKPSAVAASAVISASISSRLAW